ncbi:hypothetical protein [Novosphingobium sp. 9U]|uniref:hypothetical protein n=1 Tax=Novosphingobium sp. 9U TaxID=2653158 RepID=UPI0012F007E9|nr:hypothetical protein [Novosphingobium sp. 9U]VWX50453.1 conserved hypothetical protein [Novosphingobium sp. 9U]
MCSLPLAAAGLAIAGSLSRGLAANAQARFKAKIADRNASIEREAAQQTLQNGCEANLDHYRKLGQLKGAQWARAAAGGLSVDMGTAQWVQDDTEMLERENAQRIYQQTLQDVRGHDIQASNFAGEANAQPSAGTMALVKAGFDVGRSLLAAADQHKKMKSGTQTYERGTKGSIDPDYASLLRL